MDPQNPSARSYTWTISNFSRLTHEKYYSDVFTVGGCKWRILIHRREDQFGIYLDVPDAASLPTGWRREVYFTLTVANHNDGSFSMRKDTIHVFKALDADGGFDSFMPIYYLQNLQRGFLVNDSVIIKAEVYVLSVVPTVIIYEASPHGQLELATAAIHVPRFTETNRPPNAAPPAAINARQATETNRFDSFFFEFKDIIDTRDIKEGSSSGNDSTNRTNDLPLATPSLEEVKEAKQSLKECLSDIFKLNIKDRLAAAVSTLASAEVGLSCDQKRSIRAFRENFDDFISDFLMFEQDNSEFELQKLARDNLLADMKKNHESHLSNKVLLDELTREKEELKKRLEEVNSSKQKLMSDWEHLMAESERTKSKLEALDRKFAKAEEKKRIAEERMSRSAAAWSSLKAQFTDIKHESAAMCARDDEMTLVQTTRKDSVGLEERTQNLNFLSFFRNALNRQIIGSRSSSERPKANGVVLDSEGSPEERGNNTSVSSILDNSR